MQLIKNNYDNSQIGVLLIHGLTGSPCEMKPEVKHLTQLGFTVKAPMLPGHGGQHQDLLNTNWQDWFNGACQAYEELASQCAEVYIGGLSMGALLALMIAHKYKNVSGIILMSPTLKYDGGNVPFLHRLMPLADFIPFLGKYFYWTEDPPYGLKDLRLQKIITKSIENAKNSNSNEFGLFRTYVASLRQLNHLAKIVKKHAHKVTCPAVIIHSLEDSLTSIDNAIQVYNMLSSKDKQLLMLDNCDHVLTLDLRKKDVTNTISNFIINNSTIYNANSSEYDESNLACSIA